MTQSATKRLTLWGFIPLAVISSIVGFFGLGVLGAAMSDSAIVPMALLGVLAGPGVCLWVRYRLPLTEQTRSVSPTNGDANKIKPASPSPSLDNVPISGHDWQLPLDHDQAVSAEVEGNLKPFKFSYAWLLAILGLIAAPVLIGRLLYSGSALNSSSADLRLELELGSASLFGSPLSIRNVGSGPVTVVGLRINERHDCTFNQLSGLSGEMKTLPKELKVGDSVFGYSSCGVVRVVVETDRGSSAYSFK